MDPDGASRYPWGGESYRETIEHRTSDARPEGTSVKGTHCLQVTVGDRVITWEAELDLSSDRESFFYLYLRRVSENGQLVREKRWNETIARDFQ